MNTSFSPLQRVSIRLKTTITKKNELENKVEIMFPKVVNNNILELLVEVITGLIQGLKKNLNRILVPVIVSRLLSNALMILRSS